MDSNLEQTIDTENDIAPKIISSSANTETPVPPKSKKKHNNKQKATKRTIYDQHISEHIGKSNSRSTHNSNNNADISSTNEISEVKKKTNKLKDDNNNGMCTCVFAYTNDRVTLIFYSMQDMSLFVP